MPRNIEREVKRKKRCYWFTFCITLDMTIAAEKIEAINTKLKASQQTVAVAESVTAGLLQFALASAEEAGNIFQVELRFIILAKKHDTYMSNPYMLYRAIAFPDRWLLKWQER